MKKRFLVFLFFLFVATEIFSQIVLSSSAAIDSAYKNNPSILSSVKGIERQQALKRGSLMFDKTEVWLEAPTASRFAVGVQQYFSFPTTYSNEIRLQKENVKLAERELEISKNSLGKNVETLYLQIQYSLSRLAQLKYQDSIYAKLARTVEKRYSVGEAEYLEKILEETKYNEVTNQLLQQYNEIESLQGQLLLVTRISADSIGVEELKKYDLPSYLRRDTSFLTRNPMVGYYVQNRIISQRFLRVQKAAFFPNVFVGYLNQGERGSDVLYRFRFGVAVPLWFPAYTSKIKAARIGTTIAELQYQSIVNNVRIEYYKAYSNFEKNRLNLQYYEERAIKQSEEIFKASTRLYTSGEISYFNYLTGLSQSMDIRMKYINAVKDYNQSIIELKYLRGE
jgi:outer membrane protein, heavy metal efflux system